MKKRVLATFTPTTITVYQAFSPEIADAALDAGTFVPPFKRTRMTWIKPSFLWMMYRSGWGTKPGQERILAIDILRPGFEWTLLHGCLTTFDPSVHSSRESWRADLRQAPARIQWDPDRSIHLEPLPRRTIQVGLTGSAVDRYVDSWIDRIGDVTSLAEAIHHLEESGRSADAQALLPTEVVYPLTNAMKGRIGAG